MAQDRYELEMNAGTTFRHAFIPALEQADGTVTDYDLTGAVFKFYVRDEQKLTMLTQTLPAEHNEQLGQDVIQLYLSPEQTAMFYPHRRYYYILDMIHPSGDVERILDGPIRVRPFAIGGH